MKKFTIALMGLCMSASIYADSGCMNLAHTRWNGQAKLITGQVVNINNVVIDSVENQGDGMFRLEGSIEGEALDFTSSCYEEEAGKINSISVGAESNSLMSYELAPNNQNPNRLNHLYGQLKNGMIDSTNDTSKSYLQKN